jgi:hypothetical protein
VGKSDKGRKARARRELSPVTAAGADIAVDAVKKLATAH